MDTYIFFRLFCLNLDKHFDFFFIIIKFSIQSSHYPMSDTSDLDMGRELRLGTTDLDQLTLISLRILLFSQ
jgi:hypothetical protein